MRFDSIFKPLNLDGFIPKQTKGIFQYNSTSLEKGLLYEAFGDNSSMSMRILGEEILAGLEKIIAYSSSLTAKYSEEMKGLLKEIKETPKIDSGNYATKGLDAFLPQIPKCFSQSQISVFLDNERIKNSRYDSDECAMYKYNRILKMYIDSCVEVIYAKAMMRGIVDSEWYYLNINQATQLGIGNNSDLIKKAIERDFIEKGSVKDKNPQKQK